MLALFYGILTLVALIGIAACVGSITTFVILDYEQNKGGF